jgi:protocatechuate 3,4-dioxygenase beta subunit
MTIRKYSRRDATARLGAFYGLLLTGGAFARPLHPTPSQVEGPFHPSDGQLDLDADLTRIEGNSGQAAGEQILVRGRVTDSGGSPVANALVDVWQCNHHGRYDHPDDRNPAPLDPNFQGWAMMRTDASGRYRFKTIKPAPYPTNFSNPDDPRYRCRHIHFRVSRDGYRGLTTQMYFSGDPLIETDFVIRSAPAAQRHLLIAEAVEDDRSGLPLYTFNVVLA